MQRHWWNKSRAILMLTMASLIAACSNEEPLEIQSGAYLPKEITVQFLNDETTIDDAQKLIITQEITESLEQSYFTIELPMMHHFTHKEMANGIITPENLVLSQLATYQLTPQKNSIIQVKSEDFGKCQQAKCTLQFSLTKVAADDPQIKSLQEMPEIVEEPIIEETLPSLDIAKLFATNYWGVIHEISDHLTLKLTPIQSNGLIYGIPEHTEMASFEIGNITIDPKDPKVEILSFYSNAMPSSDVHQVDTISYLFIIPSKEAPNLDLTALDTENQHFFADQNNLLAKDTTGFYSIQYRYFPALKQLTIALTESRTLEDILGHFQAINTLQSTLIDADKNKTTTKPKAKDEKATTAAESKTILLTDFSLPLKELQSRYQITLKQMFRVDNIYENYQNEVKRILTSDALFLKEGPNTQNGYHLFTQHFGDYQFNETYLKIHNESLKNVIAAVKALNNGAEIDAKEFEHHLEDEGKDVKGVWQNPIYFYSTDPKEASGISYFKEIQPGVTLEIFSPAFQGHVAEKVLFSKLLSNMTWKNLPKLAKNSIKNIAKYHAMPLIEENSVESTDEASDSKEVAEAKAPTEKTSFYEFKEGKTTLQGELIKE